MTDDFFKFPSTPHLMLLGDVKARDDKVMTESEREGFLQHEIIVEEKVDGANLGISFDSEGNLLVQNRGAYLPLPGGGQWKKLAGWLAPKMDALFEHLTDRYILFGEWCYAQHSVPYKQLPDWFLGFDIYDKNARRFLSCLRRNAVCKEIEVAQAPVIACGLLSITELLDLLKMSQFGDKPAEGLYLRIDQGNWLIQRAKIVRPDFVQSIEHHWSRSGLKPNRLKMESFV